MGYTYLNQKIIPFLEMSEPFSLIIPNIEEYIIDAERLLINFYRISIYESNFMKVVKIISENKFNLRSILSHSLDKENHLEYELQYIFSKIYNNRDYLLVLCFTVGNIALDKSFLSISNLFANAIPLEKKIMTDFQRLLSH